MLDYFQFLDRVIDDGIEAAKKDYGERPERELNGPRLEGSVAGFEECRGKGPVGLRNLLEDARAKCAAARSQDPENYWYARCFEAEVEWVANCVSAVLIKNNLREIVPPTARATLKAAEILGVGEQT